MLLQSINDKERLGALVALGALQTPLAPLEKQNCTFSMIIAVVSKIKEHGQSKHARVKNLQNSMISLQPQKDSLSDPDRIMAQFQQQFEAFSKLPQSIKHDLKKILHEWLETAMKPESVPSFPGPQETYPLYKKEKKKGQTAIEFLDAHPLWGKMLPSQPLLDFDGNPDVEQPYLFQDDLKKFDHPLYRAIINYLRYNHPDMKIASLIPPKSRRTDLLLNELGSDGIRDAVKIVSAANRR